METEKLPPNTQKILNDYLNLKVGNAVCRVPYFNNKIIRSRGALRAYAGKGTPKEIAEEAETILHKQHVKLESVSDSSLKRLLNENNLGIDCSGFAYHVLDAFSQETGHNKLSHHLTMMVGRNPLALMRARLRPAENCSVKTLSSDTNSRVVQLEMAKPGDMITMLGNSDSADRDHILIIHEVSKESGILRCIKYTHAIWHKNENIFDSGIKQGSIDISTPSGTIWDGNWNEEQNVENAEGLKLRAKNSITEIRRLKWLP